MIHCLNPDCSQPTNPDSHQFCQSCGWRLQLGTRYEAVYSVGQGQNSQTFVGRDRTTLVNAQCLIKRFTPRGATGLEQERAAERFRREVEQLAIASQHPQMPDLMAYFEQGPQQFLVQQFLTGPHLDQQLEAKMGPFDSDEVRRFLRNVLPILQHLHQNRLIHRDIKPSNFRQLSGQSDWWLVDFGAIKPVTATQMARPGTLVGSADYASPEQLRGEATYASDLYSLGVVCLHLLTGLQPFDLFDGVNGCWQWRSIVPNVSPSLAALVDGMVQPALRDRLPDVATVMASLGMALPTATDLPSRRPPPRLWQPEAMLEFGLPSVDMVVLPVTQQLLCLTADGTVAVRSLADPSAVNYSLASPSSLTAIAGPSQTALFVTGDRSGQLRQWQMVGGTWQSQPLDAIDAAITTLQFTATGDTLLIADDQGKIYSRDLTTGRQQTFSNQHVAKVNHLALSSDNTWLATGDAQGYIKIWHCPTHTLLRTFSRQPGGITENAWLMGTQTLVTAGWDVTLRWRAVATGGILQQSQARGFALPVRSLLPHPTHPWIVSGSQDGQLQLWANSSTNDGLSLSGQAIAQAEPLNGAIVALRYLPAAAKQPPEFLCLTATGHLTRWQFPLGLVAGIKE
ncbi:MAG: protein kinase [Leptolyngbyaceae cyanobacterium]